MPHGRHIYVKAFDMAKTAMCAYHQYDHALPYWKCVLQYCAGCPCINLPDQETDYKYSYTTPSIRFHNYHIIERCTSHVRSSLKTIKYAICVNKNLRQAKLQIYIPENNYL